MRKTLQLLFQSLSIKRTRQSETLRDCWCEDRLFPKENFKHVRGRANARKKGRTQKMVIT